MGPETAKGWGLASAVAFTAFSLSCARSDVSLQPAVDSGLHDSATPLPPLPPGTFELDYSGISCSGFAGLRAGYHSNHAFSLILTEARRSFVGCSEWPGLVQGYVFFSGCEADSIEELENTARKLAAGDAAWIGDLDLELTGPTFEAKAGMCYGYRDPGGLWHWAFAPTKPVYDQAKQRFIVHFAVNQGPVDALMVASTPDVPRGLVVSRVTFTGRPFK